METRSEDRIVSEFLKSLGPWCQHVVIGGGYAPIIYKLYLADRRLQHFPVGTKDIDSLVPRQVPMVCDKSIAAHLCEAGFTSVYKDRETPATEAYVKSIDGSDVEIEFLTDNATRGDKTKNIVISGVVAQPLSYLNLSLDTTIEFQTSVGQIGRVVSPGAWMFHKGLTFTKRHSAFKKHKDLYGLWYVLTQLGQFSLDAATELPLLGKQHPAWHQTFKSNLVEWMNKAAPIDWATLEAQDPAGRLKRLQFKEALSQVL